MERSVTENKPSFLRFLYECFIMFGRHLVKINKSNLVCMCVCVCVCVSERERERERESIKLLAKFSLVQSI